MPDIKFLFSHPVHFLSLGFGSGLSKKAPGTFGTLIGMPIFFLIHGFSLTQQIVAIMLVLTFTPLQWPWWLAAFLLFRLFDIWKPYPIRMLEAKYKNGFGVM